MFELISRLQRKGALSIAVLGILISIISINSVGCGNAPDTSAFPRAGEADAGLDVAPEAPDTAEDATEPADADTSLAQDVTPIADGTDTDAVDIINESDTSFQCDPTCENGGVCNTETGICECPPEYTGPQCADPTNACGDGCQNNGTCNASDICDCAAGWTGPNCETAVCNSPCMNDGVCVAPDQCRCTKEWIGFKCDTAAPPFVELGEENLGQTNFGSPASELGRVAFFEGEVTVNVTFPFEITLTEITQAQWRALFRDVLPDGQSDVGDNLPVATMTWWSAMTAANALSIAHGFDYCYDIPAEAGCAGDAGRGTLTCPELVQPINRLTAANIVKCEGYRLPTEAEWEFAARAGSPGALYNVEGTNRHELEDVALNCLPGSQPYLSEIAWWCGTPVSAVRKADGTDPNKYGIYAALGNVAEWTWDGFDPTIPSGRDPSRDAAAPWENEDKFSQSPARTVRGGSYASQTPADLRLSARRPVSPNVRSPSIGLRLVRTTER